MTSGSYNVIYNATNKLAAAYFSKFMSTFFIPVDYTRTKEIPALLDISGILARKTEKLKILDIGSPQILSLSLSLCSQLWDITYVNSFEPELEDIREKASALRIKGLKTLNVDISRPESIHSLGTYDYILSCSVLEHIHPEHGGDVAASQNIAQLLNARGVFVFSVPYYKEKFHEYVAGDVYAVQGDAFKKTFFQRFYDEDSLYKQIVIPTGLRVIGKTYIGERYYSADNIKKRMALLIGFGKRAFVLGRLFNRISDVFMVESSDGNELRKPYLAICALLKD